MLFRSILTVPELHLCNFSGIFMSRLYILSAEPVTSSLSCFKSLQEFVPNVHVCLVSAQNLLLPDDFNPLPLSLFVYLFPPEMVQAA